MTRKRDKEKRSGGDKDIPPPANPMNLDEANDDDFTVVNLALWAGDHQTATEILENYAPLRGSNSPTSPFEYPVLASLERLQLQIVRRSNEYNALAQSASLAANIRIASDPLVSIGGHLYAIIWADTERDYELRCYLRVLSWEQGFYKRAAELAEGAGMVGAVARTRKLGYGIADRPQAPGAIAQNDPVEELSWTIRTDDMFMQARVSDFCTCTVRGIWITPDLPNNATAIIRVFQRFLNGFDPAIPAAGAAP